MSRPAKVVLLIEADATARGVTAFVLETRGYAVLEAADMTRGHRWAVELGWGGIDALLIKGHVPDLDAASLKLLRDVQPEMRVLQVNPKPTTYTHAGVVALRAHVGMPELVEQLATVVARKRGPKPVWRIAAETDARWRA